LDLDAVWGGEWGRSRDGYRLLDGVKIVERKGSFWYKCGASHYNQRELCGVVNLYRDGWRRGCSQIALGFLVCAVIARSRPTPMNSHIDMHAHYPRPYGSPLYNPLIFSPQGQCMLRSYVIEYICTEFGADSSSCFSFRVRTVTPTDPQSYRLHWSLYPRIGIGCR